MQRRGFGYALHSAFKRHLFVFSGCEVIDSVCGKLGKTKRSRKSHEQGRRALRWDFGPETVRVRAHPDVPPPGARDPPTV